MAAKITKSRTRPEVRPRPASSWIHNRDRTGNRAGRRKKCALDDRRGGCVLHFFKSLQAVAHYSRDAFPEFCGRDDEKQSLDLPRVAGNIRKPGQEQD